MSFPSELKSIIFCALLVCASGCSSFWMKPVRLPIVIHVMEEGTGRNVPEATVKLEWRTGLQGYYWGKPTSKTTDEFGRCSFGLEDIHFVSSDGYPLPMTGKLFISAIVVSSPGYDTTAVKYPESKDVIEIPMRRCLNASPY